MQHSYKSALLYLSVLLFSDCGCNDNKKIKTTQEKSVHNDSNNEKKELKEQDEATSLNQCNFEEKPKEKKEPDTLKKIIFDDSEEDEQKEKEAEIEEIKKALADINQQLQEKNKQLQETDKQAKAHINLSKEVEEQAANTAKIVNEKNKIIESKKALEKLFYDKQKNMFTGLYDKKA